MYYNDSLQLTNYYNKKGELTSVTDSLSNTNVACVYNALGQMTSYTEKQNNATKVKQVFTYDEYGNLSQEKITGQVNHTYNYSYDDLSDRRFNGMSFDGITVDVTYDNLDRIKTKKIIFNGTEVYTKTYDYRDVKHSSTQTNATNQPKSIVYTKGTSTKQNIQYTYYDMTGKLSGITVNGKNIEYYYDYDKLRRENNQLLNASFVKYCYDSGNISKDIKGDYKSGTAVISNSSSTSYSYDGDRMMSFGNQACEYDKMGNPTTYRGKSATWKGRQMLSFDGNNFTYDGIGRRTSKNSLTFLYDDKGNILKQSNDLEFFYDFEGVTSVRHKKQMYFYLRDGQGNIIAIVDSTGSVVVQYYYDAWGNHKVVDANGDEITDQDDIGNVNPFRYRGYYYDTETGLYFLQTRYYDPEVGRFLNRDSVQYADPETINGLNLYAYCLNNPVEYADPTGSFPVLGFILGIMAIGGLITTACGVASDNNIATAVGLSMITIPALISGGMAIAAGFAGATLSGIIGCVTVFAGIGSSLFASAEYQQLFTGNNWILDLVMSESVYNGLMIATSTLATLGTIASYFCYTFNIKSINGIDRYGKFGEPGYRGIKFTTGNGKTRILTFHTHSHIVGKNLSQWHWQLQKWNPITGEAAGTLRRWLWWCLKRF